MEHLADEEIDLYAAGRLPEERERALEVHYLDCAECLARVTAVQDLALGLRPNARRSGWPGASWSAALAAGLAGVVVGLLLWQTRALQAPRAVSPSSASPPVAEARSSARPEPGEAALPAFTLRAPERGETLQRVERPAARPALMLGLDAREAGAPGTVFEVSLFDSAGRSVVTIRGLASDREGRVLFPIATPLLRPGVYTVQLAAGRDTLKIPFEIAAR